MQLTHSDGSSVFTEDGFVGYVFARPAGRGDNVKSLGGFHLVTDASNENSVQELRHRKRRDSKPFAVMGSDVDFLLQKLHSSVRKKEQLESSQRPIVILQKRLNILAQSVEIIWSALLRGLSLITFSLGGNVANANAANVSIIVYPKHLRNR